MRLKLKFWFSDTYWPHLETKAPVSCFTQSHILGDLGNKCKYPLTHFEYLVVRVNPQFTQVCMASEIAHCLIIKFSFSELWTVEYWLLTVDCWLLNVECWLLNVECWMLTLVLSCYSDNMKIWKISWIWWLTLPNYWLRNQYLEDVNLGCII